MDCKGRFAPVICGDMLPLRKPDPAPLLEAIRQAGEGPAAFVGDTKVDLMTARKAGVPCLLMNMVECGQVLVDAAPGQVLTAFSDLPDALAAL
jgi:phosphoglycolate phosphatase